MGMEPRPSSRTFARARILATAALLVTCSAAALIGQTISVTVTVSGPTTVTTVTTIADANAVPTEAQAAPIAVRAASPATEPTTAPTTVPAPTAQDLGGGSIIAVPADLMVDAPQRPDVVRSNKTTVDRVLIVSIDGARPDCLLRAATPNLRSLMDHGSFSMYARTTDFAVTNPSHVSMLTGVIPEAHGITTNTDPRPDEFIKVPTIFDIAKQHGLSTAMVSAKSKFSIFNKSNSIDYSWLSPEGSGPDEPVADNAARIVREHKPQVMFVHFATSDANGHGRGWGTPEHLAALSNIDTLLGKVLAAYDAAGIRDGTLIIISADHGGTGRSHGRDDPRSRYIPWIASGPGVRQNFDLTRLGTGFDVTTFDTFATACDALKLPIPDHSEGNPVLPIYERYEMKIPTQAESRRKPNNTATTGPATVPVSPRRGTTWPVG